MKLRAATPEDAAAIAEIYAPFVTGSCVSFETEPPDEAAMRARMEAGGALYPWLVGESEDGTILGYAYAARFRDRPAYRFAAETSVYLRPDAAGRGLGRRLYEPLLAILESSGFTQAIAAITLPNQASVRLHERLRFERAGTYRQIGWKLGAWHDVGLWQRGLAAAGLRRRSPGCLARPARSNPSPVLTGEEGPKPKAWEVRVLLSPEYRPSPPTASRRAPPLPRKAGEGFEEFSPPCCTEPPGFRPDRRRRS